MRKILSILSLSAMLMAGCQKEDSTTPDNNANYPADGVVRIKTNINALESRANAKKNLYAGSDLSLTVDYGVNDKYTKNNILWKKDATHSTWSTLIPMHWKDAATKVKVYAYAPYIATQSDLTVIPFSAQADQSAGLTSSDLVGYINSTFTPGSSLTTKNAIPIKFDHKMSQLNIALTFADQFGEDVTVTSVTVNAKTAVTYNATSGEATLATDAADFKIKANGTDKSYSAIIAPQTVTGDTKLVKITLSNDKFYEYIVPSTGHTFTQGTAYALNLRIGKDVVTATPVTVSEWGDGSSQDFGGDTDKTPIMLADFAAGGRYETAFPEGDTWVIEDKGEPTYAAFRVLTERLNTSSQFINLAFPNLTELPDAGESSTGALDGAIKLKSFDAPQLTKIGSFAFYGCSGLTGDLKIPDSVTTIADYAFKDCSLLKTVTCLGNTPPEITAHTFFETTVLTSILVPSASITDYQKADIWSTYTGIISAIPQR